MAVKYASRCKYCGMNGGSSQSGTQSGGPPKTTPPPPRMGCQNSPDKKHHFEWVKL